MSQWRDDLANLRATREVLDAIHAHDDASYAAYEEANADVAAAEARVRNSTWQGAIPRFVAFHRTLPSGLFDEPFYGTETPTPGLS